MTSGQSRDILRWKTENRNMRELDRITIDPDVCLGQPTIRGMRLTVSVIVRLVASGRSRADILDAYPELEEEDIVQALRYAAWTSSERTRLVPAKGLVGAGA